MPWQIPSRFCTKKQRPVKQLLQSDEATQKLFLDLNRKIDNLSEDNAELSRKVLLLTVPQAGHTDRVFVPSTNQVHVASTSNVRPDSPSSIFELPGNMSTFDARNAPERILVGFDQRLRSIPEANKVLLPTIINKSCLNLLLSEFEFVDLNDPFTRNRTPPHSTGKCSF